MIEVAVAASDIAQFLVSFTSSKDMKHSTVAAAYLLLACQVSQSLSSPVAYNAPAGGQIVFSPVSGSSNEDVTRPSDDGQIVDNGQEHEFNVLHHLSG
jgi:hypothetical protein